MAAMKKGAGEGDGHPKGLLLIALFKLLKGAALLIVAIGARKLLHRDVGEVLDHWVEVLRVDPNNHYINMLLTRITNLDPHRLRQLSAGTFFYAAVLLTEGVGLAMRKRWAEYFTILVTSSFIPLEIWEIGRRASWPKVALLLINIAVVAYLVMELRRERKHAQ